MYDMENFNTSFSKNIVQQVNGRKRNNGSILPKGCRKVRVEVFPYHVDRINNARATKPIIPKDAEILAMGVGSGFLEVYKKKYKV